MTTVMLVDDHKIMREGLKALMERAPDLEVVAEAEDGDEAIELAARHLPEVVVMDLTMPRVSGVEATRRIVSAHPSTKVLILSMLLDRSCVVESLKAGAKGYLLKYCAAEELLGAIRSLAAGDAYLCSKITEVVIRDYANGETESAVTKLSAREREVLQLIADGKNTKEIAFQFGVSVKTVELQRLSIMKKLNLYSIAKLTKYAIREGLSSID